MLFPHRRYDRPAIDGAGPTPDQKAESFCRRMRREIAEDCRTACYIALGLLVMMALSDRRE